MPQSERPKGGEKIAAASSNSIKKKGGEKENFSRFWVESGEGEKAAVSITQGKRIKTRRASTQKKVYQARFAQMWKGKRKKGKVE